ncbi:T-complex protein 1 subunit zeta-2 isoform 5-T8 [Megaptera novaeangliae]
MGTGEPLVQLKSESKSLRARRTDDGPILRARPNQPPARCSPPQRLSREPDLQHHGQIELDCWPKEDESHVKLSHPATSACNRLALLSPPQISQTAAYLHPLNRLKNSTGIYAGDFPYWQILIYLILLRRIKSRRGGGLKWGNPERLPRGRGDSLTYLRGAGRWLQTRQENSICYNYEVPAGK